MEKLKRIYAHTELKEKFLLSEEEVEQCENKELIGKTSFLYDEDTKLVYFKTNDSNEPELFKSVLGKTYRFVNNEILLVE